MTAALEARIWNTIWALREVLSGGSLWGRYIQKRTLKKEEKKSLKKRWKIVKSFVFWIGVGKKNWRWRFRDVGSDGQVPSSDRRLLQNWVLGRHSKEANENKVEKIEYDINNIMATATEISKIEFFRLKVSRSDTQTSNSIPLHRNCLDNAWRAKDKEKVEMSKFPSHAVSLVEQPTPSSVWMCKDIGSVAALLKVHHHHH